MVRARAGRLRGLPQGGHDRPFGQGLVATQPELRRIVETAERLGISPRRLLGWEPVTVYVHDQDGRLVSSRPEPEWDDTQRQLLLELAALRADECPGCGNPISETTGQGAMGHYLVHDPLRCWSCDALEQRKDVKDGEVVRPHARVWRRPERLTTDEVRRRLTSGEAVRG